MSITTESDHVTRVPVLLRTRSVDRAQVDSLHAPVLAFLPGEEYLFVQSLTLPQAPNWTYQAANGTTAQLADLWTASQKGIVLVFLRHFGCMFCKEHSAQLSDAYDAIRSRGWDVVAIGQGTSQRAAKFASDNSLPYPVLGDRERVAYALYGLKRATVAQLIKPGLYQAGVRALLHGSLPGKPEGDVSQDPGTFLISSTGLILHAHIGQHSGDFPSISTLLRQIDSLDETTG